MAVTLLLDCIASVTFQKFLLLKRPRLAGPMLFDSLSLKLLFFSRTLRPSVSLLPSATADAVHSADHPGLAGRQNQPESGKSDPPEQRRHRKRRRLDRRHLADDAKVEKLCREFWKRFRGQRCRVAEEGSGALGGHLAELAAGPTAAAEQRNCHDPGFSSVR